MAKDRDYTRICNGCGNRWLLPKEWAKESKPSKLAINGAKLSSAGEGMSFGGPKGSGARVSHLEAQRDRFLQNATCPACGRSGNFTEYKPGKAPAVAPVRSPVAPRQPQTPLQIVQKVQGVPQVQSRSLAPPVGAWHPDPTKRFALRYYDGSVWTEHVQGSNGAPAQDRI